MSSLSIDEKMLLVQKMRSQAERMHRPFGRKPLPYVPANERETYIDLRSNPSAYGESALLDEEEEGELAESLHFLKIRLFVCVAVFVSFLAMYKTDFKIKGHEAAQVQTVLEQDVLPARLQTSLEAFSQRITGSSVFLK